MLSGVAVAVLTLVCQSTGAENPYRVRALRTDQLVVLDGDLSEEVWRQVQPATGFTQREPHEFEPATEKTEFWVVYNSTTLFIAVKAHDAEPDKIVAKEMERDATLYPDDSIVVVLDTFGDRRNGYAFETNPNGARFDALVTDEGRDINSEWDGVWRVASRRTAEGWVAEIGIPFSTLRFDAESDTWGINVRRMIRHKNEEVNWTPLGRDIGDYRDLTQYAIYRISLAGVLEGMRQIQPSRALDIKPYVIATASQAPGSGSDSVESDFDAGLDVKWGLTRSLSLDLTVNTDFAEVEADQQQVNLTRFSLFFPEKREFFLENAGIFDFGPPQRDSFTPPLMKVFFSRRIGLDEGREVPIDAGVRLTGRAGGWNVGVLDVKTRRTDFEEGDAVADTNFGVLRMKRNVGRRSGVGFIYTDRSDQDRARNQVFGVDFDYKPTRRISVDGFYSQSQDDRAQGSDWAGGYGFAYRGPELAASLDHVRANEGFVPDIGFLLRDDFERFDPKITWRPLVERKGIRALYFEGEYDYYERASTGELESRRFTLAFFGLNTVHEDGFGMYHDRETERLFAPFEIRPGIVIPAGIYRFDAWRIGGRTNQARPVSFRGRIASGGFYNGDRDWANVTMRVRASKHLQLESSLDYNDVRLPAGDFITRIFGQRINLLFTPDLRINAFLQYNSAAELVGANVRFNWIYRPGSDLFLVYNENWDAPSFSDRETRDRQLILKFTYLWQP